MMPLRIVFWDVLIYYTAAVAGKFMRFGLSILLLQVVATLYLPIGPAFSTCEIRDYMAHLDSVCFNLAAAGPDTVLLIYVRYSEIGFPCYMYVWLVNLEVDPFL